MTRENHFHIGRILRIHYPEDTRIIGALLETIVGKLRCPLPIESMLSLSQAVRQLVHLDNLPRQLTTRGEQLQVHLLVQESLFGRLVNI